MLTILQPSNPRDDPHDCTDAKASLSLLRAVYDTLVRVDGAKITPALATDWSVSPDARAWRFQMRPGVRFHDGAPCDVAAAARSIRRMAREDRGVTLGATGVWAQYLGGADIHAEDSSTLAIDLAAPVADLPDILAQGFIAAPAMLDALDGGNPAALCGTGPYRFETADETGVTARAFEDHWNDPPANRHVRWQAEPSAEARVQNLRSGEAQVACALHPDIAATLPPQEFTCVEHLDPVSIIFLMNAAEGPLADARLRRALAQALDREAMCAAGSQGAARPLHGFMAPVALGAASGRKLAPDPEAARKNLAEAGHAGDLTLTLDCPTRLPDEAQALSAELARQLAPLGVRLDIRLHEDREAYAHRVRRGEIGDLCVFDSSPLSTFRVLYEKIDSRVQGSWWQGFSNAEVEALLDQGRATVDTPARARIYARAYALLQEDPAWLTLYNPVQTTALAGRHESFAMPSDAVLDVAALPRIDL
ncbi:MAG: ABC transporter substrate-binding protein [Pseudomonadota bacterium]